MTHRQAEVLGAIIGSLIGFVLRIAIIAAICVGVYKVLV